MPAAAAVMGLAATRFAVTGVYELTADAPRQPAAGAVGLLLATVTLYAAFELEDARHRTVLPARLGLRQDRLFGSEPSGALSGLIGWMSGEELDISAPDLHSSVRAVLGMVELRPVELDPVLQLARPDTWTSVRLATWARVFASSSPAEVSRVLANVTGSRSGWPAPARHP